MIFFSCSVLAFSQTISTFFQLHVLFSRVNRTSRHFFAMTMYAKCRENQTPLTCEQLCSIVGMHNKGAIKSDDMESKFFLFHFFFTFASNKKWQIYDAEIRLLYLLHFLFTPSFPCCDSEIKKYT